MKEIEIELHGGADSIQELEKMKVVIQEIDCSKHSQSNRISLTFKGKYGAKGWR